jgi:hypothetical protein
MRCGEAIIAAEDDAAKHALCFRCKGWHCEECAPRLARALNCRIQGGKPSHLLTLTNRAEPGDTPSGNARELVHAWRMIRQQFERTTGRKLASFAVFEKHPHSGFPHLHIALRCPFIDINMVRTIMRKLLDSPQCRIDRITKANRAIAYMSKYLTKEPERFDGCKRYMTSRNWDDTAPKWDRPVMDADLVWSLQETKLAQWQHKWLDQAHTLHEIRHEYWQARPPW